MIDIWEELYTKAKEQYYPGEINPFIYAHHVVCALVQISDKRSPFLASAV